LSPLSKNIQATDRGCVGSPRAGSTQPQQVTFPKTVQKVRALGIRPLLRLVFDTAAVRLFQPAPAK
jgi:hypothetical protein